MRSSLRLVLLLVWCGAAVSQLRVPASAGRGKRPPFLPPADQVRLAPPPVVEEDPDAEAAAELEAGAGADAEAEADAAPRRPALPPPPPPPEEELRRPAFRPPPPLPAQDPLRPAFRPSARPAPAAAPAFRKPLPPPPPPPLDDFAQPARGAIRQPPPEPQLRGSPVGRQAALPPQAPRPQQQYQRNKKPVAQVIRRYREDNPDGSITWGFENDDGTFKEETIGVDCVVKGKYGYIDPDGVRREYTYNSGIPCDKNRQSENSGEGFIDYQTNKYVLPNGDSVDLDSVSKNKARKQIPQTFRN